MWTEIITIDESVFTEDEIDEHGCVIPSEDYGLIIQNEEYLTDYYKDLGLSDSNIENKLEWTFINKNG